MRQNVEVPQPFRVFEPNGIAIMNLKIYGCPKLIERCKQNTGSDWYKIAHISNVEDWSWSPTVGPCTEP
ncbi:hypothetical protein TSUD_101880 [Trifolium subterraneum]|uniref:Uncharacterized protein n=1 Tax=Trifolium subterraneum TaxID=3900 RepID=A0A2Z6M1K1_TRISU|nr:hypothetical protein TSUD_101880 [Trifolium subterraneum]